MNSKICLFLYIVLFSTSLLAQKENAKGVKMRGDIGLTFLGMTNYAFSLDMKYSRLPFGEKLHSVKPDYAYGFGVESQNLIPFYNSFIDFSVEIMHGVSSTGIVKTIEGDAKFNSYSTPLMFWSVIKSGGIIRIYLKIGLGMERSTWEEKYIENKSRYDVMLNLNSFAWGVGSGIELTLFENINMAIFVNSITKEKGISKILEDGRSFDFDSRNSVIFSGLTFGYIF